VESNGKKYLGGTGGGVVAARLAENPRWNILVIEAGPSYVIMIDPHRPKIDDSQKPRCVRDTGSGTGYRPTRQSRRLELHGAKSQRANCTLFPSENAGWL